MESPKMKITFKPKVHSTGSFLAFHCINSLLKGSVTEKSRKQLMKPLKQLTCNSITTYPKKIQKKKKTNVKWKQMKNETNIYNVLYVHSV